MNNNVVKVKSQLVDTIEMVDTTQTIVTLIGKDKRYLINGQPAQDEKSYGKWFNSKKKDGQVQVML